MSRPLGDLSLDELDGIARQAGHDAVVRTLRAGISALGIVDGVAFQVKPNGSLDVLGPVGALNDPFDRRKVASRTEAVSNGSKPARTAEPVASGARSKGVAARHD